MNDTTTQLEAMSFDESASKTTPHRPYVQGKHASPGGHGGAKETHAGYFVCDTSNRRALMRFRHYDRARECCGETSIVMTLKSAGTRGYRPAKA